MTWALLRRCWWAVPIAVLAVALIVTRERLADRQARYAAEIAAHALTIAQVQAGRADAAAADAKHVLAVQATQTQITKGIVDDYEVRLADVRGRAERLRANTPAGVGGGGGATMSVAGDAAGRADAASGEGGLPALSDADALIATEQALQLGALIDWVDAQAAVETSR